MAGRGRPMIGGGAPAPFVDDAAWLATQIEALTDERVIVKVSEWAERNRHLPMELTTKPGMWDNSYTPYLTEIMDTMSANSPVRQTTVMKGVQIGATTGLLENFLGYTIDHAPGPTMFISADADVARMGMELRIDRMLESSGLMHKIRPSTTKTKRTGDTATRKEFAGGFVLGIGGNSPGKIRMISIKNMLVDEVDSLPLMLGTTGKEEGRTLDVITGRTTSFERNRKMLWLSTPLVMETSVIYELYMKGDQRQYFVPCVHCNEMQPIEWHGVMEDGAKYGITWDLQEDGTFDPDSVGYACKHCFAVMYDYHKRWFLPRGEWRPTAIPRVRNFRSYHLPALLSPAGMHSWTGVLEEFEKAWDLQNDRPKDVESLRSFYNLQLGLPWEERGSAPKFEMVVQHRRAIYSSGQVPNKRIIKETGSPGVLVTAAVDVHADRLDVETCLWCKDRQSYSLEWMHYLGDTEDVGDNGPWAKLRDLLERKMYVADDGRHYRISKTLIDASWQGDIVHGFCQEYSSGVSPIMGRELATAQSKFAEFSEFKSKFGGIGYNITTTHYKDRLSSWLKKPWEQGQAQPLGYPNYPEDYADDYFKQYESEAKMKVRDEKTNKVRGFFWRLIGKRANHAWDCRVYNMAAYDLLVWEHCIQNLELDAIDYIAFNNYAVPRAAPKGRWFASPFSWIEGQVEAA